MALVVFKGVLYMVLFGHKTLAPNFAMYQEVMFCYGAYCCMAGVPFYKMLAPIFYIKYLVVLYVALHFTILTCKSILDVGSQQFLLCVVAMLLVISKTCI
jgi:hypothetical protein